MLAVTSLFFVYSSKSISSSSSMSWGWVTELAETTAPLSSFSRTCSLTLATKSGFSSKYLMEYLNHEDIYYAQ